MNITILGHVCIDKNTSENSSYTAAGSPAIFMEKIFHQLPGTRTTIISSYGKDFLPFRGSAVLLPNQPTSDTTLVYENITKNVIRQQYAHNRDVSLPVALDDELRSALEQTNILFIAPILPNYSASYVRSITSAVNEKAIKVLLPQGFYRAFDRSDHVLKQQFQEADAILKCVDIVIVSQQDQDHIKKEIASWTQKHPHLIAVMTTGEKGAVAYQYGKEHILPSNPVPEKDIVDSVGSGDIFSAGFAYRFQQTRDIERAGAFANALARQCLFFTPEKINITLASLP